MANADLSRGPTFAQVAKLSSTLFHLGFDLVLGFFSKGSYEGGLSEGCVSIKTQEGWIGDAQAVTSNLKFFLLVLEYRLTYYSQ